MALWLNAYPIAFDKDAEIPVCVIPYDKNTFQELRDRHRETHTFYRTQDDKALCLSPDGSYPVAGEEKKLKANDHFSLMTFLIKDGIIRFLKSQNRNTPIGFNPVEIVSTREDDNVIKGLISIPFPFALYSKYEIDTRTIGGKIHLTIDCSTRNVVLETASWFVEKGFSLNNRYVVSIAADGYRKLLGSVISVTGTQLQYQTRDGEIKEAVLAEVYLEANRENFDDYARFALGGKADDFIEKVRIRVSTFNSGTNKRERIEKLKTFLATKIKTITGLQITIGDAPDVTRHSYMLDKPSFVFNDGGEVTWQEQGFTKFGPYTKRTFDRNDPSICVICSQNHKGQIEQFVRKFLKGISGHKYFAAGLEGKFHVGTSRVEVFTFAEDSVAGYKLAIESAMQKKTQDGGKWDLALVQVRQSFKELPVEQNPYFVGKSTFLIHQVPVQDFTLELLTQSDASLGYSLNNMALAAYAKMGGVPWLLKSSPTLSHELVIGIGSANLSTGRLSSSQRIMGITTVFSGDGSYIVSNTSKAVTPDQYASALVTVLKSTIDKVKTRLNWQRGDTIRIVFHASVKKFNRDEIEAVKRVIDEYKEYNIEYAFLKISEDHGLHLFDSNTADEAKGKLAPQRGRAYKLSDYENLVYLIGQKELRQTSDGHPRGLILSVHRDSTFKDIKYLSAQLFNFSAHSWRSYFPNPMPVTITYSDLIAHNLGWLNKTPGWNDTVMHSKIGQTQWFL